MRYHQKHFSGAKRYFAPWAARPVWDGGHSRCPSESLFKVKTTCAVIHSNDSVPGGWQQRLELTGLVEGRKGISSTGCGNLSDSCSQLLLPKDWTDTDNVVRPAETVAQVPLRGVCYQHKNTTLVFNKSVLPGAAGELIRSRGRLDKVQQLGIPPYCSKCRMTDMAWASLHAQNPFKWT